MLVTTPLEPVSPVMIMTSAGVRIHKDLEGFMKSSRVFIRTAEPGITDLCHFLIYTTLIRYLTVNIISAAWFYCTFTLKATLLQYYLLTYFALICYKEKYRNKKKYQCKQLILNSVIYIFVSSSKKVDPKFISIFLSPRSQQLQNIWFLQQLKEIC